MRQTKPFIHLRIDFEFLNPIDFEIIALIFNLWVLEKANKAWFSYGIQQDSPTKAHFLINSHSEISEEERVDLLLKITLPELLSASITYRIIDPNISASPAS